MIEIQEIKEENFKDVVSLWNQEYRQLSTSKIRISIDKFRRWYNSRGRTGYIYYFAKYKNKFAGLLFFQKKRKQLLIKAIAVKKEYRKRGIGKVMIRKAIKISKELGLPLKTEVLIDNVNSINWLFMNKFIIVKFRKKTSDYLMEYKGMGGVMVF